MSEFDEATPPRLGRFERYSSVYGPRERCRGCGADKPAGFRNFCPSCGRYPVEVAARKEHDE